MALQLVDINRILGKYPRRRKNLQFFFRFSNNGKLLRRDPIGFVQNLAEKYWLNNSYQGWKEGHFIVDLKIRKAKISRTKIF